jgi:hypothetical protein
MSRWIVVAVLGFALACSERAHAQYTRNALNTLHAQNSASRYSADRIRANLYNSSVPINNYSQANRGLFNNVLRQPLSKPFSNASGGGSVSPWLALSEPFSSSAHNYYTQVRPQLDQQRLNQIQAARNQQLQRQLNSLAAQGPYSTTGNANMAPTGHVAAFFNYGGYYQPVQPTKNQR